MEAKPIKTLQYHYPMIKLFTDYLIVKENSNPAPPVMLTWQYFGSSQDSGACNTNKHSSFLYMFYQGDNNFTGQTTVMVKLLHT